MAEKSSGKNIAEAVAEMILPTVESTGCSIWDVEYVREGGMYVLRVTIDKEGGVDINDCEKVHRAIDPILDERDPIPQAYQLEVSSPGIERVIRTDAHIEACAGQTVSVKLFTAIEGVKQFIARLDGKDGDGDVLFSVKNGEEWEPFSIPRGKISRMQVYFDFSAEPVVPAENEEE